MASTYLEIPSPTAGTAGVTSFNSRSGVVVATTGDYVAAQVDFTPAGDIAATDVQAAIEELDAEKQPLVTLSNSNFVVSDGSGEFSTLTEWSYSALQGEAIASVRDATASVEVHHDRQLGLNADGAPQLGEIIFQRLYMNLDPDSNGGSIGDTTTLSSMLRLEHATTGTATMENLVSLNIMGTVENVDHYSAMLVDIEYNNTDASSIFRALEIRPVGEAWSASGITVDMSNMTSAAGAPILSGLSVTQAGINVTGTFSVLDDDKLDAVNFFSSELLVQSGTPLTQKDFFATLMLPSLTFEDDFTSGPVGIGYVSTGFICTLEGTAGKSVDKVSAFLAAVSPQNNDGIIDELNGIRIALIPAGSMAITAFRGVAIEDGQGSAGASNWGLWFDDAALENYLKKSLVIGDSDTVTNSSVGFELNATDRAMLVSRMDATERDALTAVAGMIIYNTDTNKLQVYNGAWIDLH